MRRRCSPQAVHGSRPQGQSRTTSRHAPRCSGSQRACGEEPARTKHTPRRADEHAPFEKEIECNIAPVCRPGALRSTAESRPELQIRITQLVRERSPPPPRRSNRFKDIAAFWIIPRATAPSIHSVIYKPVMNACGSRHPAMQNKIKEIIRTA